MLLLDNSAWSRLLAGKAPRERSLQIMAMNDRAELAVCLPFLLEAGFSARSAADRSALMRRLERLPSVTIDGSVERSALRAQSELTEVGHHRLSPMDILVAACADRAEAGVLHYDRGYDLVQEHTSLRFTSEWLAPPGSLDG